MMNCPDEIKLHVPSVGPGIIVLSEMDEKERKWTEERFRYYSKMSDSTLENSLEGLIKTGQRLVGQEWGTKRGKKHPLYQYKMDQIYNNRAHNAVEKAIVRYIQKSRKNIREMSDQEEKESHET